VRLNLRVALFLLIGLVAIGGAWSGLQTSSSTGEDAPIDLETKSATLVIDFGDSSGRSPKTLELNALSAAATGWDLLDESGVALEGTDQYPTGFVCRLDGWPTEAAEACDETPSYADGHWAYYVTSKDISQGWLLSGQGASSHVVDCGGVEGWKWVGPREESTPPRIAPAARECGP
jgi:hypothetical protein